ncbi:PDZ domain-containing protein [Virgibacillus byunsanensis]|uniref:PDZ domain-containing protein n=1 Tax=Virgibacillus byunsanensis TaxID=570945 RepID=A0ABW3LKE0_9BACI
MVEAWAIETAKGIGKVFLNPLLYWIILLVVISGYQRVKQERINFGTKVFDIFTEWKNTLAVSIIAGIIISLAVVGTGIIFSYETILLLSVVMIVLSLTFRFTMLSSSHTIGITYILLIFMPFLLSQQSFMESDMFSHTNFVGLSILIGLFLMVEAILIKTVKRNDFLPSLEVGSRGDWIGRQQLKKLSIIPFFTLVPSGMITSFAPFWPYFSLGSETYSLLVVPFIVGFNHIIKGELPSLSSSKLARAIFLLGVIIVMIAVGSVFLPWLSLVAVLVAIVGREYINFRHRITDKEKTFYFNRKDNGLKVLAVIPGTPADRLGILVGETIKKVNGIRTNDVNTFYQALQDSSAVFKLELLSDTDEVRFVQSAFYQGDHHELGLIFVKEPHKNKVKQKAI